MKKYESFINQYDVSKTLRFALIPMGKTEENFEKACILEEDTERDADSKKVKEYMDRYHKDFIEGVLVDVKLEKIGEYAELYYRHEKTDKEKNDMEKLEADLRKQISRAFKSDERYSKLFKADMIKDILPHYLTDETELRTVEKFNMFTTYFTGFFNNRENMYLENNDATSIAHRCIGDNLPKYLDNVKNYEKIQNVLGDVILEAEKDFGAIIPCEIKDLFTVDYFTMVLSQCCIEMYNSVIGGYVSEDGVKIKGINEYVNAFNQKREKNERIPFLKPLYKQILSDRGSISFLPEKFENDNQVLSAINSFYGEEAEVAAAVNKVKDVFDDFADYDLNGIYLKSEAVADISNAVYGNWSGIKNGWTKRYEAENPLKKGSKEKYYEKMEAAYKAVKSFSVEELQLLGGSGADISTYIKSTVRTLCDGVGEAYEEAEALLENEYVYTKRLSQNDEAVAKIKNLLDSTKKLEGFLKPFCGTGKEEDKCDLFYGEFLPLYESIILIDKLYDKTRNYVTRKPYSTEKIKLNFQNPQFLGGWDKNKEKDYLSVLLRRDECYYLAIMDKKNNNVFLDIPYSAGEEFYEKLEYKLLPGPNKMLPKVFFANSNIDFFAPPQHILDIRKKESFKKGNTFNIDDCHDFIDFYKKSIYKHPEWSRFGFEFKETKDYKDIGEFFNEVKVQGYSVAFKTFQRNISIL